MVKKTAVIILILSIAGITPFLAGEESPAADSPGSDWNLRDYLEYGALNNRGLKAAFNRWKAKVERARGADAPPDPRLSYGYFIREIETRVGPQEQKIGLSQTFPWFGTLKLRKDVAAKEAEAEYERYVNEKLELFRRIKTAYYEYYYLKRAVEIADSNLELMTYLEKIARNRYKVGKTGYSDVVQAQVELGKLEDRLETLHDLRVPLSEKLNAALDRPGTEVLPWPEEVEFEPIPINEKELFEQMSEDSPELKRLDLLAEKEEIASRLAGKRFLPDITVGVDYIDTGTSVMPDIPDSGRDAVAATVSINIPLWREKYRAEVRHSERKRDVYADERDEKNNSLHAGLRMAVFYLKDAERKIELYGNTLTVKARQSLNVTMESFRAGETDFLDLIEVQKILLEFQLTGERALADYYLSLAEIEYLVGGEIVPDKGDDADNERNDNIQPKE